jgi:hypothetical protein
MGTTYMTESTATIMGAVTTFSGGGGGGREPETYVRAY